MANSNTLIINRPTRNSTEVCVSGCATGLGPTDPTYKSNLGTRRNREQVRDQIKDYVLLMLGAPVLDIELDEQQLDLAVDEALMIFEDYAPREYFDYYIFNTTPGKSVYQLPADIGTVRNVFYKEVGTYSFTAQDLGGVIPIEYFSGQSYGLNEGGFINPTQPIWSHGGDWVLYKQYEQMYSRISSQLGGWEWVGDFGTIKLYPTPFRVNKVFVHYLQKQKDWRQVTQAMQEGALAFAKIMVGRIRSRYANPPGPKGGIQHDGATILAEGLAEKEKWEEKLLSKWGDIPPIMMG